MGIQSMHLARPTGSAVHIGKHRSEILNSERLRTPNPTTCFACSALRRRQFSTVEPSTAIPSEKSSSQLVSRVAGAANRSSGCRSGVPDLVGQRPPPWWAAAPLRRPRFRLGYLNLPPSPMPSLFSLSRSGDMPVCFGRFEPGASFAVWSDNILSCIRSIRFKFRSVLACSPLQFNRFVCYVMYSDGIVW